MDDLLLDDGIPAKAGDRVWRVFDGYANVTHATVQPHWLRGWKDMLAGRLFSTERAALAFAIEESRKRLAKARKEGKREARAIERMKERMGAAP